MNEFEIAQKIIHEWRKTIGSFDFEKQQKLGILAKKNAKIRDGLLKDLEARQLDDDDYVPSLVLMLGRAQIPEAIPQIERILHDKKASESLRGRAGRALGLIGEPALPAISKALKSSDLLVRGSAIDALNAMGDLNVDGPPRKRIPEALSLLISAMADDNDETRGEVVGALKSAFTSEFGVPHLEKALQHDNPLIRAGSADALLRYGQKKKEAEAVLHKLLIDKSVEVRASATRAFQSDKRTYDKAAIPLLQSLLNDNDARVRERAANGLANFGPDSAPAVDSLRSALARKAMDSDEMGAKASAAVALGRIGPAAKSAVPELMAALAETRDSGVGEGCIFALGEIGPAAQKAIPLLERLQSDNPDFSSFAREALVLIRKK
jgi:HEAT repeat protein